MTGNQLLTLTAIARLADRDRTTIHRRVEALGIQPALVAGVTRLYSAEDAERIINWTPETAQ